jgi:hypothetical protein
LEVFFFEQLKSANEKHSLESIQAQLTEAQKRLAPAKELYLYIESSREGFEQVK